MCELAGILRRHIQRRLEATRYSEVSGLTWCRLPIGPTKAIVYRWDGDTRGCDVEYLDRGRQAGRVLFEYP